MATLCTATLGMSTLPTGLLAQETPPEPPAPAVQPPTPAVQPPTPAVQREPAAIPEATELRIEFPTVHELFTPDGSRIVLLPTGGAPVVHWVVATPAGVLQEPAGLEGLSFAVARASLAGTGIASSLDSPRELAALALLDQLEQALDHAQVLGTALPAAALAAVEQARAASAALFDPLAWERRLREVPALGPVLHEVAEGTLLQITTAPAGVPRVAQLLYERREGNNLRGVQSIYRGVRQQLAERRGTGTRGAMRREVLGLSFLGHPYGRGYALPNAAVPLSLLQAITVWQQTQHPSRSCHVLVGGFDTDTVVASLTKTFANTRIPALSPAPRLPLSVGEVERRATLTGGQFEGVSIGYRLPAGTPTGIVRVFAQWLAGSRDAELPAALRRSGRPGAQVTVTAPFPGRTSGLLLLEIEDTVKRPPGGRSLVQLMDPVLRRLSETLPKPAAIDRAATAVRARSTASQVGNENLALQLALACGLEGQRADVALRPPGQVTPAMIRTFAKRVLARKNRAVVRRVVAR